MRVRAVITTPVSIASVYVGNYFEITGGITRTYYYAGNVRVAERYSNTLYYLLTDHLGSTAVTTDASGARVTELRYYPYGGDRYNGTNQKTTYRFTGQRWDPGTALYFYGSRWYDPVIGRFLSADTIVPQPGNPQALNRYSYVGNRPLRYTDPTGHAWKEDDSGGGWHWWDEEPSPSIYQIAPSTPSGPNGWVMVGPKAVPVYLPPTVVGGTTSDGLIPVYGYWNTNTATDDRRGVCYVRKPYRGPSMHTAAAGDYWYGEGMNGGTAVRPGVWRDVAEIRKIELPSGSDAFAEAGRGLANMPESLALDTNVQHAEVAANGAMVGAHVLAGYLQAGWSSTFYLQEHVGEVKYRVIIVTRQLNMDESMYGTYSRFYPMNTKYNPQ